MIRMLNFTLIEIRFNYKPYTLEYTLEMYGLAQHEVDNVVSVCMQLNPSEDNLIYNYTSDVNSTCA